MANPNYPGYYPGIGPDEQEELRRVLEQQQQGQAPEPQPQQQQQQQQQTPFASQNPSQQINANNPNADPDKPYVQAGNTGGYLDGVGVTIGEGSSLTQSEADRFRQEALAAGYSAAEYDDFIARNPGDHHRFLEGQKSTDHRPFDSQTQDPQQQAANRQADGGNLAQQWLSQPGAGGSGGSSSASGSVAERPVDPRNNELWKMLMERATQGLNVGRDNPEVRAQSDAFIAQTERGRRNYLSDIAEGAGPYANLRGERRMAAERAGQATGSFEAEMIGRVIGAKRNEVAQALQGLQGMLSQEEEMDLRMQLAQMDNELRRYGIDTNAGLAQQGLSQDWRRALMQNDQFTRDLGLRAEDRASYWDSVRRGLF